MSGRTSHLSSYRMLLKDKTMKSRVTGDCVFQGVAFSTDNINIFQPIREQTSTQWRHSFTPYFRHICVLFPANAPRAYCRFARACRRAHILRDSNGLNSSRNFDSINRDSHSHSSVRIRLTRKVAIIITETLVKHIRFTSTCK